jgi:hypothetical protein
LFVLRVESREKEYIAMKQQQKGAIPGWKLQIVHWLGLSKQLYLGPEGIDSALRYKLQQGLQRGFARGQAMHPVCLDCSLYQAAHETDPQAIALRKIIGTGTFPTVNGEMARKFIKKLHREQGIL